MMSYLSYRQYEPDEYQIFFKPGRLALITIPKKYTDNIILSDFIAASGPEVARNYMPLRYLSITYQTPDVKVKGAPKTKVI